MPTMTDPLARWACDLRYEHLTPDAIDAAKRFLYDSIGCALGGYQVHDVQLYLEHARELGGRGVCTVIGSGELQNPSIATLANALMIRAMDYNDILSDPAKYDPQSKESADHSLPYCIAAALAEGRVTPLEFKEEKLWDRRLRAQMAKVKVVANAEFEKAFPAKQCSRVTITTTDGRKLAHQVDVPKGDPRDPMTAEELQVKFDALAGPVLSTEGRTELRDTIFALEKCADVGELMRRCVADL